MKNKFVLNFWHALLLLICIRLVCALFYVIIGLLFKDTYKTALSQILLEYVQILFFVPFIFWFAKNTDTNFRDSLFLPDLSTIIKMFVVVVLAETIVLSPLFNFDIFFESVINSKLRVTGTAIRPLFPLLDIHLILIVPIIEELFFRGLVLKNFQKIYSPVYAILLSSILFGIYHLSFDTLIIQIILGLLLGIIFYKTNSLIIVMLAHMIWNALCIFQFRNIELDGTSLIINILVYLSALTLIVFLLKNGLKADNRNIAIEDKKNTAANIS